MKLVSLYIENFGGLHGCTLQFNEGTTAVTEANGFGKTTLAEFIRAMFYGFPRKSKMLEKSRRQKYMPWNGGQFGGNLVFELQNRRYRVERTFGANPKGDTFTVIDLESDRKTNRFTEELGQELFGLDADSFERSTYVPQLRDGNSLVTASIQAKLSDLVEDSSDVAGFDKAVAALRAGRSALIPYRGSGGLVAETVSEITAVQLQLDVLRTQEKRLEATREEIAATQQEVEQAEKSLCQICEQLQTASQQESSVLRQQYMQLQNRHRKVSDRLRFYKGKYPAGIPQEDALRRAEMAAERLTRYETAEQLPTQEQLACCRELCKAYDAQQERLRELYIQREAIIREKVRYSGAQSKNFKIPVAVILLAVAGMVAGAASAFLLEWKYGLGILVIGAAALAAGAIVLLIQNSSRRRKRKAAEDNLAGIQRQLQAVNRKTESYRQELAAFFAGFGLQVEPQQYAATLDVLEDRTLNGMHQTGEIAQEREALRLFFAGMGFAPAQDIQAGLEQLREDMQAVQTAQVLLQELEEQLAVMEEAWGDILFAELPTVQDPQQLRREEQRVRTELTAATTRLLQLQQKVQQLQQEIAQLPDVMESLEQAKQRLVAYREKADILDATMDFLQQARENLATSYMGTIRSRFGHYLSMLGDGDEYYFVDSDLQVRLERQGQARELAYFSAGQADLVMLCMRLALADALFGDQKMILILDDPFVNLDDVHTERARRLLRKLASEQQILYLTCHTSRSI